MNLTKIANLFIIIITSVVILVYSMEVLVPFILAVLVWFVIKEVRRGLRKLPGIGEKLPEWLQTTVATLLILFIGYLVINMLRINIQSLSRSLPQYEANVESMVLSINQRWNIDLQDSLEGYARDFDFANIIRGVLTSLTGILGDIFMILIYLLFLILEERIFRNKLRAIYPSQARYESMSLILEKIDKSISGYLTLKTVVSVITGVLSYVALLIIGVKAAAFWAFLIFLLNYIPTIGSLIATAFLAIFAMLQFGEFIPAIWVMVIVGAIQVLVGNVVEPKVMGNSLNISSLTVILALAFWGALWGITGMILSVPITVIMIIVFSEFPNTKPVAIMLSEKGRIG